MTALERSRRQNATFWAVTGVSSSGDPSWAAPKAIKVRWEERSTVFTNASGEEQLSGAVVYVGEDMNVGDSLLLGTSVAASPDEDAREIQGFSQIPRLHGTTSEQRAFMNARTRT